MNPRSIFATGLAALLAVVVGAHPLPARAGSITYEIQADTSGLTPGSGGLIDIQLNPASPQSPATVSVDVFNPNTDGVLGPATPVSGNATGDLTAPAGVTADNTQGPNELTQGFSVASFFDVFVTLTGSEIGPGATGAFSGTAFALTIYDSQLNSEGVTLTVNPNIDGNGNPIVDGTVGVAVSGPPVQVIVASVPEPSGAVLIGLGLGIVVAWGRLRRPRAGVGFTARRDRPGSRHRA